MSVPGEERADDRDDEEEPGPHGLHLTPVALTTGWKLRPARDRQVMCAGGSVLRLETLEAIGSFEVLLDQLDDHLADGPPSFIRPTWPTD
jgi:hypothetical protein